MNLFKKNNKIDLIIKQNKIYKLFQRGKMLLNKKSSNTWSNREIRLITRYKQRVKDIEDMNLQKKFYLKQINSVDFYKITPKQQLPKFLQKMKFQTLHTKQNIGKVVKVFKKQKQSIDENKIRKKLKDSGQIMFISQIYQNFSQSNDPFKKQNTLNALKFMENYGADLQQWEKNKNGDGFQNLFIIKKRNQTHKSPRNRQSRVIQQKLSQMHRKNSKGGAVNFFKQGSNYKKQIEKQLEIIYFTHSNQRNQMNKYMLIQNSSKLLMSQLDERKLQVQCDIKGKLSLLKSTRIQHHLLFQQKTHLLIQQRSSLQQSTKQSFLPSYYQKYDKQSQQKCLKKTQIQINQSKINKIKKQIELLECHIQNYQEELRNINIGEISYLKTSLKIGMDCRDTGLGWIIKNLNIIMSSHTSSYHNDTHSQPENNTNNNNNNNNTNNNNNNNTNNNNTNNPNIITIHNLKQYNYEFPVYLDKKSKQFLTIKTQLQDTLEHLMQQKRKFVNQIGQSNGTSSQGITVRKDPNRTAGGWAQNGDRILQDDTNNVELPKKYRRSLRKITMLNQQYAQNQSLLQLKTRQATKGIDISSNCQGLSGKKLYQTISQKIKCFDFSKTKKDKSSLKNTKLLEYQSLLNSIKDIHIKIEDLDISHQNHLISHYKGDKDAFFVQGAACFGYKKAYSMIIKHFSWKNDDILL